MVVHNYRRRGKKPKAYLAFVSCTTYYNGELQKSWRLKVKSIEKQRNSSCSVIKFRFPADENVQWASTVGNTIIVFQRGKYSDSLRISKCHRHFDVLRVERQIVPPTLSWSFDTVEASSQGVEALKSGTGLLIEVFKLK